MNKMTWTVMWLAAILSLGEAQTPNLLVGGNGFQLGYPGMGAVIARAGDMDGDGVPEVLMGGPSGSNGNGRLWVVSGGTLSILHDLMDPITVAPQPDGYGRVVASLGDIDGDSRDDFAVGDSFNQRVYLYSGASGTLLRTLVDPLAIFAGFGVSICGPGDVDGDGIPDVAVGAPGIGCVFPWCQGTVTGRVLVFSGANGTVIRTMSHPTPAILDLFGLELGVFGDLDADGVNEIAVKAPRLGNGFNVFSGRTGAWLPQSVLADLAFGGAGSFIRAMSRTGDMNADGVEDFVLSGSPPGVAGMPCLTCILCVVLSGATFLPIHTLTVFGPTLMSYYGESVSGGEDIDGDGIPDWLLGDPLIGPLGGGSSCSPQCPARVHAYSGATGALIFTLNYSNVLSQGYGQLVRFVGDINLDGSPDFMVGNYTGWFWLYTGAVSPAPGAAAGNVLSPAGWPFTSDLLAASIPGLSPTSGGPSRRLAVPTSVSTVDLWMSLPPMASNSQPYLLFASQAAPILGPPYALPGLIGFSFFAPAALLTSPGPEFMIGDSGGVTGLLLPPLLPAAGVTRLFTASRPMMPATVTLQALVGNPAALPPYFLSVTNALTLEFQ